MRREEPSLPPEFYVNRRDRETGCATSWRINEADKTQHQSLLSLAVWRSLRVGGSLNRKRIPFLNKFAITETAMQLPSFSIIMTVFEPFDLLPRAITSVCRQEYESWELLLVVDGSAPDGAFDPRKIVEQMQSAFPRNRIELWTLPRAAGCYGNVGRNFALQHATGDYVCWVNHDNLISPRYLAAHCENIRKTPGCLSIVDIDLWEQDQYRGLFPQKIARSRIDLLCFAVPLETARRVNAFGGKSSKIYAADWITFNACRQLLPIEHRHEVVGTHF